MTPRAGFALFLFMSYADPERRKEYNAQYRAENREMLNEIERLRYREPGVKEKQDEYRRANLSKYAEHQRNRRAKFPRHTLVDAARGRARKFSIPFDLTVASLDWPTHCPVLGIELDYSDTPPGERRIRINTPTLDRRDNSLGYVKGNVFVISHRANRLKSDATNAELEAILRYANG